MKCIHLFSFLCLSLVLNLTSVQAQTEASNPPKDWFHLDATADNYQGVSSNKLYDTKLKGKSSKTVVVAIIDSGVDWEHEDLADVMWVNADEIPNNGKDDDNNGYIDDIHGWNFIGGPNGNINQDNMELTRLYRAYEAKYGQIKNPTQLSGDEKLEYAKYLNYKKHYEKNKNEAGEKAAFYSSLKEQALDKIDQLQDALGKKKLTVENIESLNVGADQTLEKTKLQLLEYVKSTPNASFKSLKDEINETYQGAIDYFQSQHDYYYNTDFDPRSIVGDNYADVHEKYYGNNDYEGPDASHGTHVAGIVAASRHNGKGMDGIADNVRIMTIRAVPDGDERDKDVANAIRYAVDNGASVINMSFGKGFSWDKDVVDEAVKYATKHDVLMVHAAGNNSSDNDVVDNFPNDSYDKAGLFKPKYSKNWIEVGALNFAQGQNYPAPFSNYGSKNVDIFAPGMKIYSTIPDNEYASFQGTSMASPVVAGVAALIRSYFPKLTAAQVKDILMKSATPIDVTVSVPGTDKVASFKTLSVSGGVVNAYNAFITAEQTKGKRKTDVPNVDPTIKSSANSGMKKKKS